MRRFKNKIAIVAGGSGTIGLAIARRLSQEGAKTVLTDRKDSKPADLDAAKAADLMLADAASFAEMQQLAQSVVDRHERIEVFICTAGALSIGTLEAATPGSWSTALDTNLNTAAASIQACLPALRKTDGSTCIISSLAGLFAASDACGYVTAKHALIGLTKSVACDYGKHSVRCNAICPGWVRTAMADVEMKALMAPRGLQSIEEAYVLLVKDMPLRQVAEPEDVANAAAFLTSNEAALITGAVLTVDGGASVVDVGTLAFNPRTCLLPAVFI